MYRYILAVLVLILYGCGDSSPKEEKETQTPKIKITQNVVDTKSQNSNKKENSGEFYYSYNKEKNSTKEEEKIRTTLDAYLNIRSPYERVRVELLINRLSKDFIIKCSPCHDDYANGVIGPSLLGKSGDYIYQKIMDFKSGKKKNILMQELIAKVDDSELKKIADEIAKFNKEIQEIREGKK